MAEPDNVMGGPGWPAEWQTGWVTGRYVDIEGNYLTGTITLSNKVSRAVATISKTAVIGGEIVVPLAFGVPSGVKAQENANGDMCIEFPISTDPDVVPAEMQLIAKEALLGANGGTASSESVIKYLTAEHTLDNPLWLSGDLESVASQPGVVSAFAHFLDNSDTPIPTTAKAGDVVVYLDTNFYYQLENA
jgi:hypothetical protein